MLTSETGFDLTLRPERLLQPLGWKRPRMVFVNSMSDLFHKVISLGLHRGRVRHDGAGELAHIPSADEAEFTLAEDRERPLPKGRARRHIWLGASVEDEKATTRIAHLQAANAGVRFLSIEPLLAPVGRLDLTGIDWVIVGGESGPGARPMDRNWVINIRNQCVRAGRCGLLL